MSRARQVSVPKNLPRGYRKYGSKKVEIDGVTFHSKKESVRYLDLKLQQRVGLISELELQPEFRLEVNGILVCKYRADFRYKENGQVTVEDVKGMRTRMYQLKKKLVLACHGIEIKET